MAGGRTPVPEELRIEEEYYQWPMVRFLRTEAAGGILLLLATVVALIWANSRWGDSYDQFWHTYVGISFGSWSLKLSLQHWINDGLMALFFFHVGLEIKRELTSGELRTPKKAALPVMAAVGGMVIPALLFTMLNLGGPGARGWGIPMATDIAFALGILRLLGDRAPLGLKVFLTALAIVDDLGAVLVIAVFYTSQLAVGYLLTGLGLTAALFVLNMRGVRMVPIYAFVGVIVWYCFLKSGVHATIAGVVVAMTIPHRLLADRGSFVRIADSAVGYLKTIHTGDEHSEMEHREVAINALRKSAERWGSPLHNLEHGLAPFVSFFIMQVFALANAGVRIDFGSLGATLGSAVPLGIMLGLVVGKTVGVTVFSWIAVKSGLSDLPRGVSWQTLVGAAALAGIGFTMSLFIANLAFSDPTLVDDAKTGILVASLVAGILGVLIIRSARPPVPEQTVMETADIRLPGS